MTTFQLDSRLKQDSIQVARLELCEVRLINDIRWPWLVLVPRDPALVEIFDLDDHKQLLLAREISLASRFLKQMTSAEKINTGALGNIVRQLHIHVIARNSGDANWPGPVWGFGRAERYSITSAQNFITRLRNLFDAKPL